MKRLALILLFLAPIYAHATAITGVSFGAVPSSFESALDGARGWEFNVEQAISITALGVWDEQGDGFSDSRQVGIWNTESTLITSLLMLTGTVGDLGADNFRYVALDVPVLLNPGTFRIGAFYALGSADRIAQNAAPIGAAGFVDYVGSMLLRGGFGDPTEVSAVPEGAFGPNFLFEPAVASVPVPEPTSALLIALALTGVAGARARRRRSTLA